MLFCDLVISNETISAVSNFLRFKPKSRKLFESSPKFWKNTNQNHSNSITCNENQLRSIKHQLKISTDLIYNYIKIDHASIKYQSKSNKPDENQSKPNKNQWKCWAKINPSESKTNQTPIQIIQNPSKVIEIDQNQCINFNINQKSIRNTWTINQNQSKLTTH